MAKVVADHMAVERGVRDGGLDGAGPVLDEGIGVLEGELVVSVNVFGIVVVFAFLAIILGLLKPGGVENRGLAVFFREICVVRLNVFLLVRFLGRVSFLRSDRIPCHIVRVRDGDRSDGVASGRTGVGALGWSPGDRRGREALGDATGSRGRHGKCFEKQINTSNKTLTRVLLNSLANHLTPFTRRFIRMIQAYPQAPEDSNICNNRR